MVDLSREPSHGRETAAALRQGEVTRALPIVFVNGTDEAIEKARTTVPDALFTTSAELGSVLARFSKPEGSI